MFDYRANPELFVLEFGKIAQSDFAYTNIYKYYPNSTKLDQNICEHKIPDDFYYGPELSELFALKCAKIAEYDFVYTLASTNVDQLVPNMVSIYMTLRSWMSSIMGQIRQ